MEQLRKHSSSELGTRILETSRQELFMAMRYMFAALNMLQFEENRQLRFAATDGTKLYYNPIMLIQRYRDNPVLINRAYMHMIMHCLFRNIYECEGKDKEIWDLACDIMAEYLVDSIELSCVMRPENQERIRIYKQLEGKCRIMSANNIYYALKRMPQAELEKLIASEMFLVDEHDIWYKNDNQDDKNNDKNNNSDSNEDKEWQDTAKQMQSSLAVFGSGRGDTKGKLKQMLSASTHNSLSYRDFLRKFAVLRENMRVDMDSFDYGFYNYGMSVYGNMPLIEELEYKEESGIEDFVILLDTSGSCAYELLQKFLNVTFDILTSSESFFEKVNLHIIQCDNQVQQDTVISRIEDVTEFMDNFEVKGFGGTDFRPAFHYVNEMVRSGQLKRLKGLLYFTDGYGIYPSAKPQYDTAFVFLGEYDAKRQVPGWAIRLDLSESELRS